MFVSFYQHNMNKEINFISLNDHQVLIGIHYKQCCKLSGMGEQQFSWGYLLPLASKKLFPS